MEDLKQTLVDRLIEQIKADIELGDTTVLDEILLKCDSQVLIHSLPEEEWDEFKELIPSKWSQEQEAKAKLEKLGFYCGNLWSLEDVKSKFNCTDREAYEVLDGALQNEATMSQIWFAIDIHAESDGLEKNEEEEEE